MKKIVFIITILVFIFYSIYLILENSLSNKIHTTLKQFGDTVTIGIQVKDQKSGNIIYSQNANHYFMPASNEKLLTAAAALISLNENFTYQTQLFLNSKKINKGIYNDSIYLRFSGDPTLTVPQLDHLINTLSKAGIHNINSPIIIDDTAFDQMGMSPGSTWDDKNFCWSAPINATSIEHNCVKATLTPAENNDQPAILTLPDYPQSSKFINNVITHAPGYTPCTIQAIRNSTTSYMINGCMIAGTLPKEIGMAIDDPRATIQLLLHYLLKKNNIIYTHSLEFKKLDVYPPLFASENSLPLYNLVTSMLKESDNTIANSLFKTMGALYSKEPGSFKNGSEAVRQIINQSMQISIPDTTLIDGSGNSRYDFLTPEQIVALLDKMYRSPYSSIFFQALPIGGIDGTLKHRMNKPDTIGKVSAKTGTATAVSTLSGYIHTRKNHTLIFSILINGFVDSPKRYQELEDKICALLIENA